MCKHYACANANDLWQHLFFFLQHHPSLTANFSSAGMEHRFPASFNRRTIRLLIVWTEVATGTKTTVTCIDGSMIVSSHQQFLPRKMECSRNPKRFSDSVVLSLPFISPNVLQIQLCMCSDLTDSIFTKLTLPF